MKLRRAVYAGTIVGSILTISAQACYAKELAKEEKAFVFFSVQTLLVGLKCQGFEAVDGYPMTFADKYGVDGQSMGEAVANSLIAIGGGEYDRSKLIPEVTRLVRNVADAFAKDTSRSGKAACDEYGEQLVKVGFMKAAKPKAN